MPEPVPKITVLMTVFNGGSYLVEAVDSILQQTMSDLELIVVDDCSTDSTEAVLADYMQRDDRVRVIRNTENLGPYPSANKGLQYARAPLIARLDGDDIAQPDMLQRQFDFLNAHPDCLIVGGGYRSIEADGSPRYTRHNAMDFNTCAFVARIRMPMIHCFCFRARMPDGTPVRYDENLPIAGDYGLAAALASSGLGASLSGILIQYRMHATNITSTKLDRQRHFAHAIASAAIGRHYPANITDDLAALLDVFYRREEATTARFRQALCGLDNAIAYDLGKGGNPAIKERAAGILAEAFAKALPLQFVCRAPHHLLPLAKRFARLRNILSQRSI